MTAPDYRAVSAGQHGQGSRILSFGLEQVRVQFFSGTLRTSRHGPKDIEKACFERPLCSISDETKACYERTKGRSNLCVPLPAHATNPLQ
jgi:hypothetical protein